MAEEIDNTTGRVGREHLNDNILLHTRTSFVSLHPGNTVAQTLQQLRLHPLTEAPLYLYVIDDDKKLRGVVPIRRLLSAAPERTIESLMVKQVVALPSSVTLFTACEFFLLHRFLAFPVVDDERRMVGVVDVSLFTDELFDVAHAQSRNDVFQIIGIHISRPEDRTVIRSYRDRFPWLLANMAGGIIGALLVGSYTGLLNTAIALAFFIPVVLTLAESVSIQAMTLILQRLHSEAVTGGFILREIGKELLTALMLGVSCGALVSLVGQIWQGLPAVALVIGVSISVAMVFAGAIGLLLPSLIRAVHGDPRVASGPIVLATVDVMTLLVYLNVGLWAI